MLDDGCLTVNLIINITPLQTSSFHLINIFPILAKQNTIYD